MARLEAYYPRLVGGARQAGYAGIAAGRAHSLPAPGRGRGRGSRRASRRSPRAIYPRDVAGALARQPPG